MVGAGLAGLTAAERIRDAGRTVALLEARDRVGGRTWTREVGGVPIDLGGQWVGPSQVRVLALAKRLGLEIFPTYATGETRYRIGGGDTTELPAAQRVLQELDEIAASLPQASPWSSPRAADWDAQTFASWLDSRVPDTDRASRSLLRLLTTGIFTAEPGELSFLHVLSYIRSAGSMGNLVSDAQVYRFAAGAQALSQGLAENVGHDSIFMACPVERVATRGSGTVVTTSGGTVTARRSILAVPIAVADRIGFDPPLPPDRAQLHQRVAPGATVKVQCIYPTPFWRADDLNGRSLTDTGYVSVTYDNSPYAGNRGVLVGFIEGDQARRFSRLTASDRRANVVAHLVDLFGPQAGDPLEYCEMEWASEEWTRGCYGSNLAPGAWTNFGSALREPSGLVHWAGSETSSVWMNYMEGAVRSGERAADEVLSVLGARPSPREGGGHE